MAEWADSTIGGSQLFATLTIRDPQPVPGSPYYSAVGHAGAVRLLERWAVDLADVYPSVSAFFAMEPHRDRVTPHFHGLISGVGRDVARAVDAGRRQRATAREPAGAPGDLGVTHARELMWGRWWPANGLARLEAVDGDGAAVYCSKYSLKAGEAVPWWRIWEPGELRNEWSGRRSRGRGRRG